MSVLARLNGRIEDARKAEGLSVDALAERLGMGKRTLQARYAGAGQWTLPELVVLVDLFFGGNFGAMLNPATPVQSELREAIAEEVDRAVPAAVSRALAALEKGAPALHRKSRAS